MSQKVRTGLTGMVLAITLIGFVGSVLAQDKPADNKVGLNSFRKK